MPAWLPNAISALRIGLVPVFVLLAAACAAAGRAGESTVGTRALALGVLALIGISDLVDGYLARRHGLMTPLGATLDAVADKLAQVALLLFFTLSPAGAFPAVPVWFTALVLGRDVVLALGTLAVRRRVGKVAVVHRLHGKLTSLVVFGLLAAITAGVSERLVAAGVAGTSLLVLLSTWGYVRDGFAQVAADRVGG